MMIYIINIIGWSFTIIILFAILAAIINTREDVLDYLSKIYLKR